MVTPQLIDRLIDDLKVWSAQTLGYRRALLAHRSILHDAAMKAGNNLSPRVSEDTTWAELSAILENRAALREICRHMPEKDRQMQKRIGEILKIQIELGDEICAGLNDLVEWAGRHPEINVTPLRRFRREPRLEWVEPTLDALEAMRTRLVTITDAPKYLTYEDIADQCGITERMIRDRKESLGPADRTHRGRLRKAWLSDNPRLLNFIAQHRALSVHPTSGQKS